MASKVIADPMIERSIEKQSFHDLSNERLNAATRQNYDDSFEVSEEYEKTKEIYRFYIQLNMYINGIGTLPIAGIEADKGCGRSNQMGGVNFLYTFLETGPILMVLE